MKLNKPYIIAEAASNHMGNVKIAKKMIWVAKKANCNAIKFQSWLVQDMKKNDHDQIIYQPRELTNEEHFILKNECKKANIDFLTSIFDRKRVTFLTKLHLKMLKVPSTYCGDVDFLKYLRNKFPFLLVSTGMTTVKEIEAAAKVLKSNFAFLHCVSLYPTKLYQVHLARMNWLKQYTPNIGWSDHVEGIEACKLAIAMGAMYIEKHFDLTRDKKKPFNASPKELKEIVEYSNLVKKMKGQQDGAINEKELTTKKIYKGKFGV